MTLSRRGILVFIVAALLPFFAFAQQEDALRAAIRADLMSDPRSSEMSPTEIDGLVEALAVQAEAQGTAQDYLDAQNSFEEAPPPVYEEEPATWSPMAIAIFALVLVLACVATILIWHRNARRSTPSVA